MFDICSEHGCQWDIKFNALNSYTATFSGECI